MSLGSLNLALPTIRAIISIATESIPVSPSTLPTINSIPTFARCEGDGPPLVMLHGMSATSDIWYYTVEAFRSGYRVIVPDLPGHGRSGARIQLYTLKFYVEWLDCLLAHLGVEEPVTPIGNSLGGAISLAYAMAHPDRVRRLVLADPLGLSEGLPWSALTNALRKFPHAVLALITHRADPYLLRYLSPWVFRDPWGPSYEVIMRMAALNFRQGFWAVGAGLSVVFVDFFLPRRRRAFLNHLDGISAPTLVIWGRHDRMLPLGDAHAGLARLPHAQVEIMEDSAHSSMAEQPEEFNALLRKFLDETR